MIGEEKIAEKESYQDCAKNIKKNKKVEKVKSVEREREEKRRGGGKKTTPPPPLPEELG